jgi:hypothetical protein
LLLWLLAPLSLDCNNDLGVAFCAVVGFAIPEKWQSVQKKGRPKPTLLHKRRLNENVYIEYHESLSSQLKKQ